MAAGWSTFVNPFSIDTWLATIIATGLGAFMLAVTYYFSAGKVPEEYEFNFALSLFISITSLFQQGKKMVKLE
jgi:hypothetical protein